MTDTVDLNNTRCIVEQTALGETIINNVCTGARTVIEWTGLDWFVFSVAVGYIAFTVFLMIMMFIAIAKGY